MRKKLAGWKSKMLSVARRITFAKAVLYAILNYVLSSSFIPSDVCQEMEKIIQNFVWDNLEEKKWVNLIKWDDLCKDMKCEGLGFKKFAWLNNAFLMKIGFNLIKKLEQLWVQVLKGK